MLCPWVGYRVELKNVLKFTLLQSELGLGKVLNRVAEKRSFFFSGKEIQILKCVSLEAGPSYSSAFLSGSKSTCISFYGRDRILTSVTGMRQPAF